MAHHTFKPTVDFRGLPFGMDPDMFYQYAITRAMSDSKGLEWLIYRLMPHSLIKSFAVALDPFSNFRLQAAGLVTPPNRKRIRTTNSVLDRIYTINRYRAYPKGTIPNWNNIPGQNSPMIVDSPVAVFDYTGDNGSQPNLPWQSRDTTRRTRPIGSDQGELLMQKPTIISPPRTSRTREYTEARHFFPYGNPQVTIVQKNNDFEVTTGAMFMPWDYEYVRATEETVASNAIRDNVLQVFAKASPFRKRYTLFRNLVELRDLPRSIRSLNEFARSLSDLRKSLTDSSLLRIIEEGGKVVGKIPDEYLSYMFGWRQLYKDTMDLLAAPDRISKDANFVISRSGKETTLRAKQDVLLPAWNDPPSFRYIGLSPDRDTRLESILNRECKVSVVLNTGFTFPDLMQPNFNRKFFLQKLGVVPSATDLYNLTPWTWLVDWFTGVGNYLDAIEQISSDRTLINYGTVTCDLVSTLTTTMRYANRSTRLVRFTGTTNYSEDTYEDFSYTHQSQLIVKTKLRRDVLTAMSGLRSTSDSKSLTTYQSSIIGALLAQRSNFRR